MPLIETKGAASAQGFGEFAQQTAANYIEDVFSTWLYTGNNSNQTITNGIDLSTKGGLVWIKQRNGADIHYLWDTARGSSVYLSSDTTNGNSSFPITFNTNGFVDRLGWGTSANVVSWTFRKQPKFFDVVTYTGNGATSRNISHSLGADPGCIIVKRTSGAGSNWSVYHRSTGTGKRLILNQTSAVLTDADMFASVTSTTFSVSGNTDQNDNGETYVAYLFASCPGVSKVGSYTGTGALQTINCGFTGGARFVLIKRTDSTGDWFVYDSARGITSGNDPYVLLNSRNAEVTGTNYVDTTSVGFQVTAAAPAGLNANGGTYIFLAVA
jgi:hypothetical protein